jgi:hypothetical protein
MKKLLYILLLLPAWCFGQIDTSATRPGTAMTPSFSYVTIGGKRYPNIYQGNQWYGLVTTQQLNAQRLNTVNELATFNQSNSVLVTDPVRGGLFRMLSGSYTVDNGTVFSGPGGTYWVRQYQGAKNIRWYGALGDSTTNSTTAFQNAMNTAGDIYVPKGKYIISGTLAGKGYTRLIGEDRNTTQLIQTQNVNSIVVPSNQEFFLLDGLFFNCTATGTKTNAAISISGKNNRLQNLVIVNYQTGIKVNAGTTPLWISNSDILLCSAYGVDFDATGGTIVGGYIQGVQCQLNGTGFRIKGNVNGVNFLQCASRSNNGGLVSDSDGAGGVCSSMWFVDTDVDSNHNFGIKLNAGNNFQFNGSTWLSNPAGGDPLGSFDYNFLIGSAVTNVTINGLKCFNVGKNGIDILGNKVTLIGADFENSGRTSFNNYDAIYIAGSGAIIKGSRTWSDNTNAQTRYGLNIASAATNYLIQGNDFSGVFNSTKVIDVANDQASIILGNKGINDRTTNYASFVGGIGIGNVGIVTGNGIDNSLSVYNDGPVYLRKNDGTIKQTFQTDGRITAVPGTGPNDVVVQSQLPASSTNATPNTLAKYNSLGYLNVATPNFGDASAAAANTAFVQGAIADANEGTTRTGSNITISTKWNTYTGGSGGLWRLPPATGNPRTYYIKNAGTGQFAVATATDGLDIFAGQSISSFALAIGEAVIIHFDGVQYQIQ